MASIISQYSTSGFYNAPVSKGLLGYMFLTCTALNVPLLAHLKKYLICKLPDIFYKKEFWRIVTCKLSFLETKDLIFGSLLIYFFRIFERRYGSHKFASCLVASQVISVILEVSVILLLQWFKVDFHHGGYLPPGPYGVIFPLFVSYFYDIPRVTQTNVVGIPITGKTLSYILGVQVCATSSATVISAICGIVAGAMYRYNVFYIQQFPWVPKWLGRLTNVTLGRLLASSPPQDGPVGATLELQRQEQIEIWEQQTMMNRAREMRNRPMANGDVGPFMQNAMGQRRGNNPGLVNPAPSEEHIQTLIEMGFERQRVISALQSSHNDINTATHILLQQS